MANLAQLSIDLIRDININTIQDRDKGTPKPAVIGMRGDLDMRGFLTDELQNQELIQYGVNGQRTGSMTLNLSGIKPKEGTLTTVRPTGGSSWNQTYSTLACGEASTPVPPPCGS